MIQKIGGGDVCRYIYTYTLTTNYCFLPKEGHAFARESRQKWEVYRGNLRKQYVLLHQRRVRKFCRKFVEMLQKYFCNGPFPNDPISELLTCLFT